MNRIQQLSRDIRTQRLKLQMGIDPSIDMDHETVRDMWRELNLERLRERMRDEFDEPGTETRPNIAASPVEWLARSS